MVRETVKLRRRVARAKEEIERLNVEVRRLHTAIRDESRLFKTVLHSLKLTDSLLHGAVQDFTTYRRRINAALLERIHQVYALPGFSGVKTPGKRAGGMEPSAADGEDPDGATEPLPECTEHDHSEDEDEDEGSVIFDEELDNDIGGLIQFSTLAL